MTVPLSLLWVQHDAITDQAPAKDSPTWIACPQGFNPKVGGCAHLYVHREVGYAEDGSQVLLADADGIALWACAVFLNFGEQRRAGGYRGARAAMVAAERDYAELQSYGWRVLTDAEVAARGQAGAAAAR